MGARTKITGTHFCGIAVMAAFVGIVFQTWAAGLIVAVILAALLGLLL